MHTQCLAGETPCKACRALCNPSGLPFVKACFGPTPAFCGLLGCGIHRGHLGSAVSMPSTWCGENHVVRCGASTAPIGDCNHQGLFPDKEDSISGQAGTSSARLLDAMLRVVACCIVDAVLVGCAVRLQLVRGYCAVVQHLGGATPVAHHGVM